MSRVNRAMQLFRRLPVAKPTVLYRSLPEGGVLLATDSEVYFGLNEVGARIWEMLPPRTSSFDELCARIQELYPDATVQQIRQDVDELLAELLASGLVVEEPEGSEWPSDPGVS